jgi:phosphoribosylanthranilate isomerase
MTIKICGITRLTDARAAVVLGVHALGFVFWARSPRFVAASVARPIIDALPSEVVPVGVFVDPTAEELDLARRRAGIRVAQIHGEAPDQAVPGLEIVRVVHLEAGGSGFWPAVNGNATVLVDTFDPINRGGTGRPVDWARVAPLARTRPVILSGGLTAENVTEAIRQVRPSGVDVSSGVELSPGVKDPVKLAAFVAAVQRAL